MSTDFTRKPTPAQTVIDLAGPHLRPPWAATGSGACLRGPWRGLKTCRFRSDSRCGCSSTVLLVRDDDCRLLSLLCRPHSGHIAPDSRLRCGGGRASHGPGGGCWQAIGPRCCAPGGSSGCAATAGLGGSGEPKGAGTKISYFGSRRYLAGFRQKMGPEPSPTAPARKTMN